MADFVAQYGSELIPAFKPVQKSHGYIDEAAGAGKGIDCFRIQDLKGERQICAQRLGGETSADCRYLSVRAFVDYRCDRRFQNGVDYAVRGRPRVDITAGTERLGAQLDAAGRATFRLPSSAGAELRFGVPAGYEMCANSANPLRLEPGDFRSRGVTRVDFRVVRARR